MLNFLSNLGDCFKEQVGLGFCSDRDLSVCLVLNIWGTVFKGTWWTQADNTWRSTSRFNTILLVVSLYWYTAKQYAVFWFLWDYCEYFSVYFRTSKIQAVSFIRGIYGHGLSAGGEKSLRAWTPACVCNLGAAEAVRGCKLNLHCCTEQYCFLRRRP